MMNRHALVSVIEEGMGIELSDRIKYIRTIMDELQRLDSHLLFYSCCAQDLGALTAFIYGMRDREQVLNVMEETTGGRLIQNYYRIGGCQADIDPNLSRTLRNSVSTSSRCSRNITTSLQATLFCRTVSRVLACSLRRMLYLMDVPEVPDVLQDGTMMSEVSSLRPLRQG